MKLKDIEWTYTRGVFNKTYYMEYLAESRPLIVTVTDDRHDKMGRYALSVMTLQENDKPTAKNTFSWRWLHRIRLYVDDKGNRLLGSGFMSHSLTEEELLEDLRSELDSYNLIYGTNLVLPIKEDV